MTAAPIALRPVVAWLGRNPTLGWALLVPLALLLGVVNRFVQDDAFISYRYAEHLVGGHGLVWNVGEAPVEGYTNFLWVLLIAAGMRLGVDPVAASTLLGLLCGVGTVVFTHLLALRVLGSTSAALLAGLLLATNYTFSAYMTGGLETQLHTFLLTAAVWLTLRGAAPGGPTSRGALVTLSLVGAAAVLTRLDAVLPMLALYLFLFASWWQRGARRGFGGAALAATAPGALIGLVWLAWKLSFYGNVLPNTFYVKAASGDSIVRGLLYVGLFLGLYGLLPVGLLALLPKVRARLVGRELGLLGALCLLWCAYVVRVGGDFMEFRFVVAILPLVFILVTAVLRALDQPRATALLVALLLAANLHHATSSRYIVGVESIDMLAGHVPGWELSGQQLAELFPGGADAGVRIAVTAAGAVPYHSKLSTLDMHGLNDAWVARNGLQEGARTGHSTHAPLGYIVDQQVHLLIGHPRLVAIADERPAETRDFVRGGIQALPDSASAVELPLGNGEKLRMIYLTPHPAIDEALNRGALQRARLLRSNEDAAP